MDTHPHTINWDVLRDPRGHFTEPHTGHGVELGTKLVRDYLGDVHGIANGSKTFTSDGLPVLDLDYPTMGPTNRV